MTQTEIILIVTIAILLIKVIKELAYIHLYAQIIILEKERKLIPENDPRGVADKI